MIPDTSHVSLRDEARVENLRVAGQLGLVSGDPNSVLGALRRITQTGTPRQQLIAELLLQTKAEEEPPLLVRPLYAVVQQVVRVQ